MASANAELVRRFFELVGPADLETVAAREERIREFAAAHAAPGFEWVAAEVGEPLKDVDAVFASHRDWLEPWEDPDQELEEVLDAGDRVVAVVRLRGRARLSGIEAEMRTHFVFTFRDGKVARVVEHVERADALAAAGLAEG